jgi:hypothetical protein
VPAFTVPTGAKLAVFGVFTPHSSIPKLYPEEIPKSKNTGTSGEPCPKPSATMKAQGNLRAEAQTPSGAGRLRASPCVTSSVLRGSRIRH